MITPGTEVVLYIQNKKIPTTIFFSAKIREFEKIFPKEIKLIEYEKQNKVEDLEKEKNNSLQLLEDQKKIA